MDADSIVNGFFSNQTKSANNPADNIVDGFMAKQENNPHPLDDSYVAKAKADQGDQSYNGYCESFAEQVAYGKQNIYGSAAEAWSNYVNSGKARGGDVQKAPKGAMIYFAPDASNWGDGHVGFSDGQGNLVSATSQGVKSIPLNDWIKQTGQTPLGYVIPNQ